ncbi:MAG TPA: trigger factor [Solirubrobacterales bacterium]|nr:trigger factor [Solirubrobacterales bacterium]
MRTSVTELEDSRVRVEVEVEADAVQDRLDRAAHVLARDMRMPGFRKGKVPPQLVIQRVGREAVMEQALRDSLPEWYERALLDTGITPVGEPELDVPALPDAGEELSFTIEVSVRPTAKLGEYKGLEVGRAEAEVPEEAIQAELDRLREGFASLDPVDRPAASGDLAVIDYSGTVDGEAFDGSQATDLMVELGAESLLPEFDHALMGATAGDEVTVEMQFPADHRPESLAGKQASFTVNVKEVREKKLPELNDEFAAEASEFETLAELRDELRRRIAAALEARIEAEFREAAVDVAAEAAQIELPSELVHARAHEMWDRLVRALSSRGASAEAYLRMQGKTREQMVTDMESDAERALRREATLAAVADSEEIDVSDEELLEALQQGGEDEAPGQLLERLRANGRDALLREDLRMRKAAELIAGSATPIPQGQAAAREKLWTPEKERAEGGESSLWTPGEDR